MIFNIWRPFPLFKPKHDGWYTCSLVDGTVMDLYYLSWAGSWMDNRRQSVFDGYKVYNSGRAALEENRVYDDRLCNRTFEVIAWKNVNQAFCWWWKNKRVKEKEKDNE